MSEDSVDRARLGTTIRHWIERGKIIGEKPGAFVCIHEGTSAPVHTARAAEIPDWSDAPEVQEKIDNLIETIAQKLEGDASGHGGSTEQYYVELRYSTNMKHAEAREPFSLSIDRSSRRGKTEKPDERGIAAMAMRHMDNGYGRTFAYLERAAERADARAAASQLSEAAVRRELSELRAAFDDLLTAKEERAGNAQARSERAKMVRELFLELKTWGHAIAFRLADNEKIVPEGELAPEQKLLRVLVREMEAPVMISFVGALAEKNPRVGLLFGELIMKVQDEDLRRMGVHTAAERLIESCKTAIAAEEGAASTPKVPELPTQKEASKVNGSPVAKQLGSREGAPLSR